MRVGKDTGRVIGLLLFLQLAGLRDPFGHEWLLGHQLEAMSSDEIKRRFEAEQRA